MNQIYPSELLQKYEVSDNLIENLRQLDFNEYLAVAASLGEVQYHNNLSNSVYCFDGMNNIYDSYLKFIVRDNFSLINKLNRFIQHAIETGQTNGHTNGHTG